MTNNNFEKSEQTNITKQLSAFVSEIMGEQVVSSSYENQHAERYEIHTRNMVLHFFPSLSDFRTAEVRIACGEDKPYTNPKLETLYTMHVPINNHIWTMHAVGHGILLNEGNILDCSHHSKKELANMFRDIRLFYELRNKYGIQ